MTYKFRNNVSGEIITIEALNRVNAWRLLSYHLYKSPYWQGHTVYNLTKGE